MNRFLWISLLMALLSPSLWATVLVSNKPVALLYKALRPETAIDILLASNVDLHTYSLRVQDIVKVQQAEQVIWLGPLNEPFLKASAEKSSQQHQWIAIGGNTLHPWLSQQQVIMMIKQLTLALVELHPTEADSINQRAKQLIIDINQRFLYWQKQLQPLHHKVFLLGHNAFDVFAKDIGIQQVVIYRANNDHGHKQAGMKELIEIQQHIKSGEIACALEEPEVSFAALKKRYPQLTITTLDPLANNIPVSAKGYLAFIDENAQAFEQCFTKE